MIREDNYSRNRSGDNWRRTDCGTIAPFDNLPEEDVCNFPYAVLEVKLQTNLGAAPPQWVSDLIESHLVEEVPKFSKFIHGVATLLESRVTLLPFWLPQMDKDIRKTPPKEGALIAVAPTNISKALGSTSRLSEKSRSKDQVQIEIEQVETEADERTPLIGTSGSTSKAKRVTWLSDLTKKPEKGGIPSTMNGKKIVLPVRVEPKVFFANERTFLSWLHFCIVLGGLALGLLNFGDKVGQISGLLFTGVAMLFMLYAMFLYQWRAEKIRNRGLTTLM